MIVSSPFLKTLDQATHSVIKGDSIIGKKKMKRLSTIFNSIPSKEFKLLRQALEGRIQHLEALQKKGKDSTQNKRFENVRFVLFRFFSRTALATTPSSSLPTFQSEEEKSDEKLWNAYKTNTLQDSPHLLKGASTQAKKELFNEICEQENEKGIQLFIKRLPLTTLKQSFFKSLNERRLKTVALLSDSIQPHICEDLFTQAFKKNDFLLCRSLLSQISSNTIHRLFYMVIKRRDKDKFLFLLPNVRSDKILLQTLSRAARKGSDQVVRSILPFISHEKLIETLEKFCFSLKIKGVKTLLPFINQVESQKLFPRLCAKGLEEVVTIFIESGLINSYKEGFLNACENECVDLIALMQDLVDQSTINKAFLNGSLNGSEEIVALLSESVTVEVKQNGFLILCKEGNHSMVDHYLHTMPDALRIQGCCKAVMNGKFGLISLLLDGVEEEEIKKTIGSLTIDKKERTRLLLFCLLKKLSPKGFSELFDHHPSLRLSLLQLGNPTYIEHLSLAHRQQYAPYLSLKGSLVNYPFLLEKMILDGKLLPPPPNAAIEANPSLLINRYMDLFNSLNYQNPNEPDYLDPDQIYDEELDMCVTVEEQKEALEDFLLRVVNRTPYLSLPNKEKKPEEFERVYQQLETMLRHILEKIKTEPSQEKALYLNMLAISGRKCGTRNIQETTQLYLRATQQTKSLEQLTSFPLMVQYELCQLVQKITYALIPSGGENAHALQVVSKALKGESTLHTGYTDPFEASGEVSSSTVKEQFHALCDPIYLVTQVINLITTHHKTTICGTEIDLYDLSLEWFKTQTSRNNSYAYLSELFNMEGAIEELPLGKITPIAALDLLKKLGILKEAIKESRVSLEVTDSLIQRG